MTLPTPSADQKNHFPHSMLVLLLGLLILLSIPVLTLSINWEWSPELASSPMLLRSAYWASQSTALIALILLVLLLYKLKLSFIKTFFLLAVFSLLITASQGIKQALKESQKTPRPYVTWLEKKGLTTATDFYALPNKSIFIKQQDLPDTEVSPWLQEYWASNTSYSFPSGHTLFAALWALLTATLFYFQRAYVLMALTLLWGMGVEASRLYLGMHWPRDLLLSCVLAFLVAAIGMFIWFRWINAKSLKKQEEISILP